MTRFPAPGRVLVLAAAVAAVGCGSSEPTGPKENLSEKEKQQIRELNEQRQQEWSPAKRK